MEMSQMASEEQCHSPALLANQSQCAPKPFSTPQKPTPSTCKHLGHIGTEFCSELWDLPTCGMTTVSRPGLLLAQQCPGFSSAAVTEFEQPLP